MSEGGPNEPSHRLSRRVALRVLAGSASVAFPVWNASKSYPAARDFARVTESPKFFNTQQVQTIDALSETIIPADEHSPGASAARLCTYIDALIADSDEEQQRLWIDGIAAIDKMAEDECGRAYRECTPTQQVALVQRLSENEENPQTVADRFFLAIKTATIHGYYTSEIGIHKELEYQGNEALPDFEGCSHPAHKEQAVSNRQSAARNNETVE